MVPRTPQQSRIITMRFMVFLMSFYRRYLRFFLYNNFVAKIMPTMTRYGDHNARNRELLAESQQLYNGGASPYAVEYQRKFCCVIL